MCPIFLHACLSAIILNEHKEEDDGMVQSGSEDNSEKSSLPNDQNISSNDLDDEIPF